MKPDSLEPLSPDLRALIDLESEAYPVDEAVRASVLSRVEMAVQLSPPVPGGANGRAGRGGSEGGVGARAAAGGATRLLAVAVSAFVAGGAAGSGATWLLQQRGAPVRAPQVAAPEERDAGDSSLATAPSAAAASALAEPRGAPAPPANPRPARSGEAPLAHGDLAKEREVLDVARAALARGRPDDALAACDLHARKWARGDLTEEREVVRIQALVAAGRRSEAERRAAEFRSAYPRSMFLPAVDAALGGE